MWLAEDVPDDRRTFTAFVAQAGAAVAILAVTLRSSPERVAPPSEQDPPSPAVVAVTVTEEKVGPALTLPGQLFTSQRAVVSTRANGYVRRLLADLGDRVRAGQDLAELDVPDVDLQVRQARTSLGLREAELVRLEARDRYARLSAANAIELLERGVVPERDTDRANEEAAALDATVNDARQRVAAARDALRRLEVLSKSTYVRAPIDGTITRRFADAGALVHAGPHATPLFEIAITDPLSAAVAVPAGYVSSLRIGAPAELTVRELHGRVFGGRITRMAIAPDPQGGPSNAEVTVSSGSSDLLAGMDCEVTLALEAPRRVARIPARALVIAAQGPSVATVGQRGHVHLVPVRLGRQLDGDVEVVDGLEGGERVLAAPNNVSDGMSVQPVDPESL